MAKSIALAADASRLASLLLSYIQAVCAFVAPRHPGASAAIIDRLSHSRALSRGGLGDPHGIPAETQPTAVRADARLTQFSVASLLLSGSGAGSPFGRLVNVRPAALP